MYRVAVNLGRNLEIINWYAGQDGNLTLLFINKVTGAALEKVFPVKQEGKEFLYRVTNYQLRGVLVDFNEGEILEVK